MKNNPLVSCVIPTFNRGEKIGDAIESVLIQTYKNLEILVVDDQSIDNTKDVVAELAKSDSRIKYLLNPVKGANNARNHGILNAKGEFIALLDDDDVWLESKIEKQLNAIHKLDDKYGVVFCSFLRKKINSDSSRIHPSIFSRIKNGNLLNKLLKRNFIGTPTLFIKTEVFKKSGLFNPAYKSFQDWELLIRIAKHYNFCFLREPLVNVFESGDSITLNKKNRAMASFKILKQNMELYNNKPRLLSFRYCSIGFSLLKLKYKWAAKLFLCRSLKHNFLNIEALFYLFVLLFVNSDKRINNT